MVMGGGGGGGGAEGKGGACRQDRGWLNFVRLVPSVVLYLCYLDIVSG